mgnify:CR=1 FL=1
MHDLVAAGAANVQAIGDAKGSLRLIEADQVATPSLGVSDNVDGIVFDTYGNPKIYHVLDAHPGDLRAPRSIFEYHEESAKNVLHYFRALRPGQTRGVPEIAPVEVLRLSPAGRVGDTL